MYFWIWTCLVTYYVLGRIRYHYKSYSCSLCFAAEQLQERPLHFWRAIISSLLCPMLARLVDELNEAIMIAMCMCPAKYWLQMCLNSSYKQLLAMHKLPRSFISRYYSYAAVLYFLSKLLLKTDVASLSSPGLITVLGSYNSHFHFRFNRRGKNLSRAASHYYVMTKAARRKCRR